MFGLGTLRRVVGEIRTDVAAARERDPAARNAGTTQILLGWAGVQAILAHRVAHAMHEAGVRLLAGTDAPLPGMTPGFAMHDELAALQAAGLSAEAALAAATVNAGRVVRERTDAGALFGTIEAGARADLVLVPTDPRDDLRVLRTPQGVMARGTWYGRSQLLGMLSRSGGPVVDDGRDRGRTPSGDVSRRRARPPGRIRGEPRTGDRGRGGCPARRPSPAGGR